MANAFCVWISLVSAICLQSILFWPVGFVSLPVPADSQGKQSFRHHSYLSTLFLLGNLLVGRRGDWVLGKNVTILIFFVNTI